MPSTMLLLAVIGLQVVFRFAAGATIKVAAFDIKALSMNKISNQTVLDNISQILRRYDLILIQEIRGQAPDVMARVVADMNSRSTFPFGFKVSQPLGRSSYKEEYAFIYRFSKITLHAVEQYDDGQDDHTDPFEREPFIVEVHLPNTYSVNNFVFIGIHVKPSEAKAEIASLVKVHDYVVTKYGIQDVLIGGNMNADCSYMPKGALSASPLHSANFTWLIDSSADTSVSPHSSCAYDRFIVTGSRLKGAIVPGSAKPYNFQRELGLTYEEAQSISIHYPIELDIA